MLDRRYLSISLGMGREHICMAQLSMSYCIYIDVVVRFVGINMSLDQLLIIYYYVVVQQMLWSACADAQADLNIWCPRILKHLLTMMFSRANNIELGRTLIDDTIRAMIRSFKIWLCHDFSITRNWANTRGIQQCGMCDQQRLRPACAYAQSDQSLC